MVVVLFADFEAFQHGDEGFKVKELCFLSTKSPLRPLYFIFKPTTQWESLSEEQRRTYAYEERFIHHLSWGEGTTHYCGNCVRRDVERAFLHHTDGNHICYVLGRQKAEFLRAELPKLNIVEYDYVNSFKTLPRAASHLICCYRMHGREHCAVLKCYRLLSHYLSAGTA